MTQIQRLANCKPSATNLDTLRPTQSFNTSLSVISSPDDDTDNSCTVYISCAGSINVKCSTTHWILPSVYLYQLRGLTGGQCPLEMSLSKHFGRSRKKKKRKRFRPLDLNWNQSFSVSCNFLTDNKPKRSDRPSFFPHCVWFHLEPELLFFISADWRAKHLLPAKNSH